MRLPIIASSAIRRRRLIEPGSRVLVALSGGADSTALLLCLKELSVKRDLHFELCAAHMNHGLRGSESDADEVFSAELCAKMEVPLCRARSDINAVSSAIKRSTEETARIVRRAFLAGAAGVMNARCAATAHHADDRIETVLYRICRGTGLSGLQGIGWTGPLELEGGPEVSSAIEWREPAHKSAFDAWRQIKVIDHERKILVRPLLGCTREQITDYLNDREQSFRIDNSNFDQTIPRNALRHEILPLLEAHVHPGARMALWRLAEEAEVLADKRAMRREWLSAFADLSQKEWLVLPAPRIGAPPEPDEIADALEAMRHAWGLQRMNLSNRVLLSVRRLFIPGGGPKTVELPGGLRAERRGHTVTFSRIYSAGDLL